MKKIILFAVIFCFIFSCEKSQDKEGSIYIARIVDFDLNCNTCVIEFPYDALEIKEKIGVSPDNYYQALNLSKSNFQIGQLLKISVRKPETADARACITLFPTYSYKSVIITNSGNFNNLIFNDTSSIPYHECLFNSNEQMYLCLDSVLNDSRCPLTLECIWAGNAEVRFKYVKYNTTPLKFTLNTTLQPGAYTISDGYKVTLIELSPYPSGEHPIVQKDYKVKIKVESVN